MCKKTRISPLYMKMYIYIYTIRTKVDNKPVITLPTACNSFPLESTYIYTYIYAHAPPQNQPFQPKKQTCAKDSNSRCCVFKKRLQYLTTSSAKESAIYTVQKQALVNAGQDRMHCRSIPGNIDVHHCITDNCLINACCQTQTKWQTTSSEACFCECRRDHDCQ